MPLTDVILRSVKPRGKPFKLADGGGMYLEVSPRGGTWWRLKYRFEGKEKRISLGVYPTVTLKEARNQREAARKQLAEGIDPGGNRKAQRATSKNLAANNFEVIAREWFGKHAPTWAPNHAARVLRLMERDLFPWLNEKPITAISAPDLLAVLRRIEGREAVDTAHRARSYCGQIFRYAISTGRATSDPSRDLREALRTAQGKHFAAVLDSERLGAVLRAFDSYPGTIAVQSALRLMPLVFVRPGELRTAKWENIDLGKGEWHFVTSKTKVPQIVPLSSQAIAILADLQPITCESPFVFPSARTNQRPMSEVAILAAMRRMDLPKEEISGHGFRATARTMLEEVLGFRYDIIEQQLGHAVRDPNGRAYNRTMFLGERRKMMQAWADHLDKLKAKVKDLSVRV